MTQIDTSSTTGSEFTPADAAALYGVDRWGCGYFSVGPHGQMLVHPTGQPDVSIDLKALVDDLSVRGIEAPVLLRFSDLIRHRIGDLAAAFRNAIERHGYHAPYHCVYPIKVNQQRHVVEEICEACLEHGFGLEAGSKPELLAVMALLAGRPPVPIVCNGFKDAEYIETVILAQKIGMQVIPVAESLDELETVVKMAQRHDVRPIMGVRVKLSTRKLSRWEASGGPRSKFGFRMSSLIELVAMLKRQGMADCLKLVHGHPGSQISNLSSITETVNELGRVYVELRRMGVGVEMVDVGGGLGIDYDGSNADHDSSMNYTVDGYADAVVGTIKRICDETSQPHPTVLTESGRAIIAFASVLVFDVLEVTRFDRFPIAPALSLSDMRQPTPDPVRRLIELHETLNEDNAASCFDQATDAFEAVSVLFNAGQLSLALRGEAERLYWTIAWRAMELLEGRASFADDLVDTYFCNLSIFQSLPDTWAVDQQFPIVPIHRLNERPTRRGVIVDLTCDSDGCVNHYIRADGRSAGGAETALHLHDPGSGRYLLGAFLVGAYQEILGDLHNLFGDTHAVHIGLDEDNHPEVQHVVWGDSVREVLTYVQYDCDHMASTMRRAVERAVKHGKLTLAESAQLMQFYEHGLNGYTYFEGR